MDDKNTGTGSMEEIIQRINALYHKSKKEGLTDAEKEEQAHLRKAYVANIRAGLRGQLDQISIVEKDGSITNLKDKAVKKNKKTIREKSLQIRDNLSTAEREKKSGSIRELLYAQTAYEEAEVVLSYAEYKSEVQTLPIIRKALEDEKQVLCPKVRGNDMEFYLIENTEMLKAGYRGILEPVIDSTEKSLPELLKQHDFNDQVLMLMPGCAFDKNGGRLGYGKGFYDRYLKKNSGLSFYKIALAYECQMWPEIPQDEKDVGVDMVITEEAVYKTEKNNNIGS